MIAKEKLVEYVNAIEDLNHQMDELKDSRKEIFDEIKNTGFDTKIIRKIIAIRAKDPDELAEEEQLIQVYMDALEN